MNIVIVTHERADLLRATLESIAAAEKPACYERTIVVENGSAAGAEAVVDDFRNDLSAEYRFVKDRKKTVSLNHTLELIDDGLAVFFDDDIRIEPQTLAAYARASAEGANRYFGGPSVSDYDVPPPDWLQHFLPDSAVGFDARNVAEPHRSRLYFLGFNWAADVNDLRACGGFSEDFGPGTDLGGGDETFMQFQLQQAGIKSVYVPDALVSHYVPASRCSASWGLRRFYLGGINHGINYEHYQRTRQLPVRRVRATTRFLRRRTSRKDVIRLCWLHPAGRYWLRHCLAAGRGFWEGISRGKRDQPLNPERWRARGIGPESPYGQ